MSDEQRFSIYFDRLQDVFEFHRNNMMTDIYNVDLLHYISELLKLWNPNTESLQVNFIIFFKNFLRIF